VSDAGGLVGGVPVVTGGVATGGVATGGVCVGGTVTGGVFVGPVEAPNQHPAPNSANMANEAMERVRVFIGKKYI